MKKNRKTYIMQSKKETCKRKGRTNRGETKSYKKV